MLDFFFSSSSQERSCSGLRLQRKAGPDGRIQHVSQAAGADPRPPALQKFRQNILNFIILGHFREILDPTKSSNKNRQKLAFLKPNEQISGD